MKEDEQLKRYAQWYDKNIYKYNIGEVGKDSKNFDCFNGYMCYLLRCRMIHGDPNDIEDIPNRKQSSFVKDGYEHVFIRFTNKQYSEFFRITTGEHKIALFCKSIPQLVMHILSNAEACYIAESDKSKFFDGCTIQTMPEVKSYILNS